MYFHYHYYHYFISLVYFKINSRLHQRNNDAQKQLARASLTSHHIKLLKKQKT